MAGRPTGTVTFLFTDIEGSTVLWRLHPSDMSAALLLHDAIVRGAIERCGGVVFSTAGDGVGAAFWTAEAAVDAASQAQQELATVAWPGSAVVRVRMGIHTGSAEERDQDYFGPVVNRAARIMAAGHGGQVLVSDVSAQLIDRRQLRDLGVHQLKDLGEDERLWQLGSDVHPPLRSSRPSIGNLPQAASSFVGRTEELERLVAQMRPGTLTTLSGVGGVGKTRLALECARTIAHEFTGGAWFCELATLEQGSGVVPVVAAVVGIRPQAGLTTTEAIIDVWRDQTVLLVLDNCEHVLDAAGDLAAGLVAACPGVVVLATSREPLAVDGERVWPVRSLDAASEAAELFVTRSLSGGATIDDAELPTVVELCRQLDGIPLAIELAAARSRVLAPAELLSRLSERFSLLRGGARGGVERHRTLAAALDWSYGLLSPAEQLLLDRLAVFSGSFDLAAIEAVCAVDPIEPVTVLDLLSDLVDKSMVVSQRVHGETRYRLLETVRQYAEDHLRERDEVVGVRDRHLAHYLDVADAANEHWLATYTQGARLFDIEWDNLRGAAEWAITRRDSPALGRFFDTVQSAAVWSLRYEMLDWATLALELPDPSPATFAAAAIVHGMHGRFEEQLSLALAGIAAERDGVWPDAATCWGSVAGGYLLLGHIEQAVEAGRAAYEHTSRFGPGFQAYWAAFLAFHCTGKEAERWAQDAQARIAGRPNPLFAAEALAVLSRHYAATGRLDLAERSCRDAIALADAHDISWSRTATRTHLALLATNGFVEDATGLIADAISVAYEEQIWLNLWAIIPALAGWWARTGRTASAAVVTGHLTANNITPVDDDSRAAVETADRLSTHFERGASMDRHQLVPFILNELSA